MGRGLDAWVPHVESTHNSRGVSPAPRDRRTHPPSHKPSCGNPWSPLWGSAGAGCRGPRVFPPSRSGAGAGDGRELDARVPPGPPARSRRRRPLPAGEWGRAGGSARGAPLIAHPRALPPRQRRPDPRGADGDVGNWDPGRPCRDVACGGGGWGGHGSGVCAGFWGAWETWGPRADTPGVSVGPWQRHGVPGVPTRDKGCPWVTGVHRRRNPGVPMGDKGCP